MLLAMAVCGVKQINDRMLSRTGPQAPNLLGREVLQSREVPRTVLLLHHINNAASNGCNTSGSLA